MIRGHRAAPARRGLWRAVLLAVLGLGLFVGVTPACGSSEPTKLELAPCTRNSDCKDPYLCALGRCRTECKTSKDCDKGGSCITNSAIAVCQPAAEKNAACERQTDCPSPLACATDYRCRNLCQTDADCNTLGITGRVCATDQNGVRFCAETEETKDGVLVADPAKCNNCGPVAPPVLDNEGGAGGNGPDVGGTGAGGSGAFGATSGAASGTNSGGNTDAGASGAPGGSSGEGGADGGSGGEASNSCVPSCGQGQACVNGGCVRCGGTGDVCCEGESCGANLSCGSSGRCACGGSEEACCNGTTCTSGLTCDKSVVATGVCSCGGLGQSCCAKSGEATLSCSEENLCAGSKCTCIAELQISSYTDSTDAVVRLTDGTVWHSYTWTNSDFAQVVIPGSGPLIATAIARPGINNRTASALACAIRSDGTVWCFPLWGLTLTDSTFFGAGLGATDATSTPLQVVTSVGGAPLANVTQIVAGTNSYANFCALTRDGSIWCWGYGGDGQLGRGDTSNANVARQVLANATTPFTDAAEVRLGTQSACARKTDGSVWCWGTNADGELGVLQSSLPSSYYPVQVPFIGTAAQRQAKRLIVSPANWYCGIMQDTGVVCWGFNRDGQSGAPVSSARVGPTSVLVAEGGPPLTGVIDIANGRNSTCARTEALDLLCWGNLQANNPYASTYVDASSTGVSGVRLPLAGSVYALGYVAPSGLVTTSGTVFPYQPCSAAAP